MPNHALNDKIIDINFGAKLVGYKMDLALDILSGFIQTLPSFISQIQQAYTSQNHKTLLKLIHKFHGGLCYCGLPRLKNITEKFEKALKNNDECIDSDYEIFLSESFFVLEEAKKIENLQC